MLQAAETLNYTRKVTKNKAYLAACTRNVQHACATITLPQEGPPVQKSLEASPEAPSLPSPDTLGSCTYKDAEEVKVNVHM